MAWLYLAEQTGGLRRCLCAMVCRCLTDLMIVAALPRTRRRPKSIWPVHGFWLDVDDERRRRCRRGVRFGSCVPMHRSHPSPLVSGPAAPTPRATLLPCAVVLVLIR